MSRHHPSSAAERDQPERHGIPEAEIERQLALFANPPPPLELVRPCTPGDGVERISENDRPRLLEAWRQAARAGRISKFVPASGAATRMFAAARVVLSAGGAVTREELARRAAAGDKAAAELQRVVDHLEDFAFHEELRRRLGERSVDGDLRPLLETLLGTDGLGYGAAPKALVDFHRYDDGARTAFEEHFVEAFDYVSAAESDCRLHFTVSAEHREAFEKAFAGIAERLERRFGRRPRLTLSTQDPATHTIAVDAAHRPVRDASGELLLRPSGHGALIGNLQRAEGELVVVKNIDNVAPERLQPLTVLWKRLLLGRLSELRERCWELTAALEQGGTRVVDDALELVRRELAVEPPGFNGRRDEAREWLRDRLDRPLRVCGVVPIAGEPGGGPFWVRGHQEGIASGVSGQIVEPAQVDREAPGQLEIWRSATHFNPVDLACSLTDRHGRVYDLARFVDPATAFISSKIEGARKIRALERPGLWNGAMAGWNTVFVEVPAATFTPVKTLADLLRPEHRR